MKTTYEKYFFAAIWGLLPIIIGVILDRYYSLAWALLIAIIVSLLLLSIYLYFHRRFNNLSLGIENLNNRTQFISDALGTSDECEEKLSWSLFWSKVQQLVAKIEGSDFKPDLVISFGRSGAVVGGMLASNLGSIKHIGFDRLVVIAKKPDYPEERNIEIDGSLKPNYDALSGKAILCVMSECTTGNTLHVINEYFRKIPNVKLKTAVLFAKTNVVCMPDFYVDLTDQKWPELPFRIDGKWKNYYPRVDKKISDIK